TRPTALAVAGPGTNRDRDTCAALALAGADPEIVLASELVADPGRLDAADLLVVAGGFSYGDALGAGRMLALDLTGHTRGEPAGDPKIGAALRTFVDSGRPVLGICNGFQVLTRAGLLPGSLGPNHSGRFDCRWVTLSAESGSISVWLDGDDAPIECPIAHGEGRYAHPDPGALAACGQVALRYTGRNPNGSVADIAGVSDPTGVVLGLMPHPENHMTIRQHPAHRRGGGGTSRLGLRIFAAGVRHARRL
ncbi:MAG: phosphoribosylformylglycinamidine synthase subunit PurQ, partial [Actinomycetota bacterium]|nr:phosphoribosylformylglycinamidine synthase subunit PurQ [Actinomycetota bacterium]